MNDKLTPVKPLQSFVVACLYTGRTLWIGKAYTERGAMRKAGTYTYNSVVMLAKIKS